MKDLLSPSDTMGTPAAASQTTNRSAPHGDAAPPAPPDPVCVEVPVRVQGSRVAADVGGITERAEPFDEQTSTLILFPQGAVVRLSAKVATGQTVVLTNLQSNRDVRCRVVKARSSPNAKSYVEIEFAQEVAGFWGNAFPSQASDSPARPDTPPAMAEPTPLQQHQRAASRNVTTSGHLSNAPDAAMPPLQEIVVPGLPARGARQASSPFGLVSLVPTEPESKPRPADSVSSGQAPFPAAPSFRDRGTKHLAAPAANPAGTPGPAAGRSEPAGRHQPGALLAVADSPVQAEAGDRSLAPSFEDLPLTFGKSQRSSARSYEHTTPGRALEADLGSQSAPKRAGRGGQRRAWMLTALSICLVAAVAWTTMVFFRSQTPDATEMPVSPSPAAAEGPSPSSTEPTAAQDQPSLAAAPNLSEETEKPADSDNVTSGSAEPVTRTKAFKLTGRKLIARAPAPRKMPLASEEPPPVLAGGVPGLVPGGAADVVAGGMIPGVSAAGIVPARPGPKGQASVRVGGDAKPPRLVSSVAPVFPSMARERRIAGEVSIQAEIDRTGKVAGMKVVSGHPMLQQAAMDALAKWKYEPAKLNGQPVAAQVLVTVKFKLQ